MLHVLDLNTSAQILLDSCRSSLDQLWPWAMVSSLAWLERLNLLLSVSKAMVICHPECLCWGEVRWLPRLSQPVQCKDRKSQGSTPLTPRPATDNFNKVSTAWQVTDTRLHPGVIKFYWKLNYQVICWLTCSRSILCLNCCVMKWLQFHWQ